MVATLAEGVVPLLGAMVGCRGRVPFLDAMSGCYMSVFKKNTFVLFGSIWGLRWRSFVCSAHPPCCGTVSKKLRPRACL